MSQSFDVIVISGKLFESPDDTRVESGPAIVQQRAVDHFTGKRMFETIFQVGKQIAFEKKFRCLQIEQITLDLLVGQAGHGL